MGTTRLALVGVLLGLAGPLRAQQSTNDTAPSVRWKLVAIEAARRYTEQRTREGVAQQGATSRVAAYLATRPSHRFTPLLNAAVYLAADSAMADPALPSRQAAVAAASTAVIVEFLPGVSDVATRRLDRDTAAERAGGMSADRVEAGARLGRAIAARTLVWGHGDGDERRWQGTIPTGPGMWWSAPNERPGFADRLLHRPWVLRAADQFRPGPPPAFGSPEFWSALDEVRRVARSRSGEQTRIAQEWGLSLAIDRWEEIVTRELARLRVPDPRAAKVLAMLGAVGADAGIACADAKYHYWLLRPSQADSTITLADKLSLPNFPAYPSGHACISGAIAEVVGHYVPELRDGMRQQAEEAAVSRLYAGLHFRFDNDVGLEMGRRVARYAIAEEEAGRLVRRWR